MANSHTVRGVLGFLMSIICTRRKIVWAGEFRQMRELDSNLKSLQRHDSIHYMTGDIRQCGCCQVRLKIQRTRQWWKCTGSMHSVPLWTVWCMPSGLKTWTLNTMQHTGWSKSQCPGWYGGGQIRISRMESHMFGYERRMHTLLITNGMRTNKLNSEPVWRDTLHRVLQERAGCIDGGWHIFHGYSKTPRIGMTFQDNGTMNGQSILGWILRFSDGWETHSCEYLSTNQQSIPSLTKTKHHTSHSCTNLTVSEAPCLVHFLLKMRSYFVLCQAKFIIWSGGSRCFLQMIWIFSTCLRKWTTMSAQIWSSNSKIRQIPLCL